MKFYRLFLCFILLVSPLFAQDTDLIPYRKGKKWGYTDRAKQIIIPIQYESASLFTQAIAKVSQWNKQGLIDASGKVAVSLKYEYLEAIDSTYQYFVAGLQGKFGLIDRAERVVVPFQFPEASCFAPKISGEMIAVRRGKQGDIGTKWGFYDVNTATQTVPFLYDDLPDADYFFAEGLACVIKGKKAGYINAQGKVVIPFQYDVISFQQAAFRQGEARLLQNEKYIVLNPKGEIIRSSLYSFQQKYNDSLTIVCFNGRYGIRKNDTLELIPEIYEMLVPFQDSLFWASKPSENQKPKVGVLDQHGKTVLPFEYHTLQYIDADTFWVSYQNKHRLINRKNEVIRYLNDFAEIQALPCGGYWAVHTQKQVGLLNKLFNAIKPFQAEAFAKPNTLCEVGLLAFQQTKKWGMMDKNGQVATAPHYKSLEILSARQIAQVETRGQIGYTDLKGTEFFEEETVALIRAGTGGGALRNQASMYGDKIATIPDRTLITVLEITNADLKSENLEGWWVKVDYKGIKGYLFSTYLNTAVYEVSESGGTHLYQTPQANAEKIGKIAENEIVFLLTEAEKQDNLNGKKGGWAKAWYNGIEGYIFEPFLQKVKMPEKIAGRRQ
jgi:hypothetical protein